MGLRLKNDLVLFGGPRLPAGTPLSIVDVGYPLKEGEATYACLHDGNLLVVCLTSDNVEESPVDQSIDVHPSVYLRAIG